MAAAPHLFDDLLVASPELALVDVDLAAQLREEIRTDEAFRPRAVARPEFRLLYSEEIDGEPAEDTAAVEDVVELPEYVVQDDDVVVDVEPVVVALDAPAASPVVEDHSELPDYVVAPEPPDEVGGGTAFLDVVADTPPAEEVSELPDYVVRADEPVNEDPAASDYPVLPDLGEASVALEETDVALRKIREQLASEETSRRHRHLRRGFIAASGLGAVAALAIVAVDLQLGIAGLPGWLGF